VTEEQESGEDGRTDGSLREMRTRLDFTVPGILDRDGQKRAEALLGRNSHLLVASKAYRFGSTRLELVRALARDVEASLAAGCDVKSLARAQTFLWSLESHLFMQVEDLAALIHAVSAFSTKWERGEERATDLIADLYIHFGDSERGDGTNPVSVLRQASSSTTGILRALWLPRRREWGELYPGAPGEQWQPIYQAAKFARCMARGVLTGLESDEGREWYRLALRYKHCAPVVALDLVHSEVTLAHPEEVTREDMDVARQEIETRMRQMHVILPEHPHTDVGSPGGPVLWSFDCTAEIARKGVEFSQAVAKLEVLVAACVAHRAESPGAKEFLLFRGQSV
jgi:hypothetical protein